MSEVGIRALKQHASAVVARAAAGEVVIITDRGRRVAQLAPLGGSRLEELLSSGEARPARRLLSSLPAPQAGPSIASAVLADRADERY